MARRSNPTLFVSYYDVHDGQVKTMRPRDEGDIPNPKTVAPGWRKLERLLDGGLAAVGNGNSHAMD